MERGISSGNGAESGSTKRDRVGEQRQRRLLARPLCSMESSSSIFFALNSLASSRPPCLLQMGIQMKPT
jgi:hypothetical protein